MQDTAAGMIPTPSSVYHSSTEAGWWIRFETKDGDWLSYWAPDAHPTNGAEDAR